MSGRVLFYVQHLLGVGHLRRAELIAQAMVAAGLDVTVAFGGPPVREVSFSGVHVVQLPPATIANEDFTTLLDALGAPIDDAWRAERRARLIALFRACDPDVLMIELFPFGRRQFRFELLPLLEEARALAHRPAIVASVRDILVARRPERVEETVETLRRFFDAVLVHGDPSLLPFGETFTAAAHIADLIRYTGYVAAETPAAVPIGNVGEGEVIISTGGGAVGAPLLLAAMAARPMTPLADHPWRFLTGPNLGDADYARLSEMVDERTVVERFRPDFPSQLRTAALSISQGGYNTTLDVLAAGVRAVVVPYEAEGETEQRMRAEILAAKGLLVLLPAADLTPVRLAAAVAEAAQSPRASVVVDLEGAMNAARIVANFALERRRRLGQ